MNVRPQTLATLLFLACLATSAFFFAQGTTSLVATKLFGVGETTATAPAAASNTSTPATTRPRIDGRAILERNIFVKPPEVSAVDAGVGTDVAPPPVLNLDEIAFTEAPPCTGDVRVLGAIINPANPDWSYASLAQGQAAGMLFRPGQAIASKTVLRIDNLPEPVQDPPLPGNQRRHRTRVVLQDGAAICQIVMFGGPAPAAGAATTAAATPAAGAAAPGAPTAVAPGSTPPGPALGAPELASAELEQGITRNSDTSFTVNRALMERVLSQQDALFRSTRLIPNEDNGSVNGMKVYGIRRSSVLGRLGIQNGDVLQSVNGAPMTSADALMTAYSALGRTGTFSISVVRRGQPTQLDYTVQ